MAAVTVLEVTKFNDDGWKAVGHPLTNDEANALAKAHGDGLYCWTREGAHAKHLRSFFFINFGVVYMPWGPTDPAHVEPPQERATIAEAAAEFAAKCYKVHLPSALSWKLELVFDDVATYTALHKAAPDLPYRPYALADALTEAAVKRFGDGVILRDGGDIAIRTAKIETVSEFRDFLRGFATELMNVHLAEAA